MLPPFLRMFLKFTAIVSAFYGKICIILDSNVLAEFKQLKYCEQLFVYEKGLFNTVVFSAVGGRAG